MWSFMIIAFSALLFVVLSTLFLAFLLMVFFEMEHGLIENGEFKIIGFKYADYIIIEKISNEFQRPGEFIDIIAPDYTKLEKFLVNLVIHGFKKQRLFKAKFIPNNYTELKIGDIIIKDDSGIYYIATEKKQL
jgi:hypothetical protein